MRTMSFSELTADKLIRAKQPFRIKVRGRVVAAIIPGKEADLDTLEILSSPQIMKQLNGQTPCSLKNTVPFKTAGGSRRK